MILAVKAMAPDSLMGPAYALSVKQTYVVSDDLVIN